MRPLADNASEKEKYIFEKSVELNRWRAAIETDRRMTEQHEEILKVLRLKCLKNNAN